MRKKGQEKTVKKRKYNEEEKEEYEVTVGEGPRN